ncbi:hypothetical protein ASF71_09950 [Deinococcus sp. Leaf326]|nr:hypothetical protein ASF71_09950 [Deinococcus sp. Leaf326]
MLEQGHYLTIDKKKVKTGEQNHYTVIDFSDVKALTPKKGKNKLTKRVNGKQGQEAAAPKEKTQVEEVKIEELIATPSSSLYEAYKAAVMKHVLHSDVKLWSEKTFNTKAEKHDKAKLQIAYELLLKEQNKTSAKVYLLSPEQLISAYYPKVMNVITTRKADVEKEKAEELHKKVQEISFKEAASRGFVTESELKDFMELNGKLNTTQKSGGYNIRWDEIKPKMVEAYRAIKQEIQAASGF